ncbi:YdhK family protein [Ureibacillus chungkukjangi]|uniref:YdhK family protein n=1 Tax=Ureibacillus chungkukjangi TaxID=1202712 RepID=UPI00203AA10D|nr:YdhK family protein [Ureibacillus chungkukjangi]MCM3388905.1 YdhK family protein [Ureibacillus chungkukjangi]
MDSKLLLVTMTLLSVLLLSACGWGDKEEEEPAEAGADITNNLDGSDKLSGEEETEAIEETALSLEDITAGLKESENPKFPVGSTAVVNASHTDGMEGAMATIKAAYDTTVYSVSYTPTNGDPFEENHKWFVEGEITPVGDQELVQDADVIIHVNHIDGMLGAEGAIDTVEETTVYVVDYTNALGETVTDHLWLKESELETEEESDYDTDSDDGNSDSQ